MPLRNRLKVSDAQNPTALQRSCRFGPNMGSPNDHTLFVRARSPIEKGALPF